MGQFVRQCLVSSALPVLLLLIALLAQRRSSSMVVVVLALLVPHPLRPLVEREVVVPVMSRCAGAVGT